MLLTGHLFVALFAQALITRLRGRLFVALFAQALITRLIGLVPELRPREVVH